MTGSVRHFESPWRYSGSPLCGGVFVLSSPAQQWHSGASSRQGAASSKPFKRLTKRRRLEADASDLAKDISEAQYLALAAADRAAAARRGGWAGRTCLPEDSDLPIGCGPEVRREGWRGVVIAHWRDTSNASAGEPAGSWRAPRRAIGLPTALALLNLAWRPLRRVLKPDYVFVVYPGDELDKRRYCPAWLERLLGPVVPSGISRFGGYWGLMVSGHATIESLESSPGRFQAILDDTTAEFPDVEVIALGGRLPSLAHRAGVEIAGPFTQGRRGTLCAMAAASRELARLRGQEPAEMTIAVSGGAGFIGSQLVRELAHEFRSVIALDPRHVGAQRREGRILFTDRVEQIAAADGILVLTARGDDATAIVPFMTPGTVLADDTHPEIPGPLRRQIASRGVTALKVTMSADRFRTRPRVPMFQSDDIPGCLLEALVVLERGGAVLESQAGFDRAAHELGFRVRLSPHVDTS